MAFLPVNGATSPSIEISFDWQNDPTSVTQTWTDITPYVVSYSRQPVRTNEFDQPPPATATVVLRNDDNRFTPDNPAGPYFGGLKKFRRIRVRCQWAGVTYNRFWGYVQDWPQTWAQAGTDQTVTLNLADGLFQYVNTDYGAVKTRSYTTPSSTVSSGFAISSIVGTALPSNLDAGRSQVDAPSNIFLIAGNYVYGAGSYGLSMLHDIAASENGVVYADGGGTIVFHDRAHRVNVASSATIGDGGPGEIPYIDPQPIYGDVWSVVAVTPHGATSPLSSINAAGQSSYFSQTLNYPSGGTYLVASSSEAQGAADYLSARYSNPVTRFPSVELVGANNPAMWPTILALDTSSLVTFKRRLPNGQTITLTEFVEGYGDTVQVGSDWRVQVPLSPAGIQTAWVLGTSALATNTTLFY